KGVPNFGFPNIKSWVGLSVWPTFSAAAAWSTRAIIPMPLVLSTSDSRSRVAATEWELFFATMRSSPVHASEGTATTAAISAGHLIMMVLLVVFLICIIGLARSCDRTPTPPESRASAPQDHVIYRYPCSLVIGKGYRHILKLHLVDRSPSIPTRPISQPICWGLMALAHGGLPGGGELGLAVL